MSPHDARIDALAERLRGTLRTPRSTYRVQLNAACTFDDLRALVPYLDALGVDTCYLSPSLAAKPGSSHGYDVVDHQRLNPELGDAPAFARLTGELRARGMGVMFDVVPNHMNLDPVHNRQWRDVLENGQSAASASWFDIDWRPVKDELQDKVLLPILGDQYGLVLERGELQIALRDGALVVRYFEHELPLDPSQTPLVLGPEAEARRAETGGDDPDTRELLSVLTAFGNLPGHVERDAARRDERRREREVTRERFAALLARSPETAALVARALQRINGEPGRPDSFDALHALLERQPYRLAYWRTALDEINYRRFFDVIELGAVRMEDPAVFAEAHRLVLELVRSGAITAIRLDHPDGLNDPEAYFERLQAAAWRVRAEALGVEASDVDALVAWRQQRLADDPAHWTARPLYLAAEKILVPGERFRSGWAINGGVGYLFLNQVNGLFIDRAGLHQIERLWKRLGGPAEFHAIAYECRSLIARTLLASEMNMLAHALELIVSRDRRSRDFTLNSLRKVLRDVVACFPVYRTYVTERGASANDRLVIAQAVADARRRSPVMEASIFDLVEDVLGGPGGSEEPPLRAAYASAPEDTGGSADVVPDRGPAVSSASAAFRNGGSSDPPDSVDPRAAADARQRDRMQFAMRFQQITGPIQAKGLEDTAFYRYCPLLAINEVGSDPANPSLGVEQFHDANRVRLADWPVSMLTLSTHDTKRSSDARARLAALTERPDEWRRAVAGWMRLNARHRTSAGGAAAPDRADEYHLYQALLAIWPAERESEPLPTVAPADVHARVTAYMVKAIREAKIRSSWLRPDAAYEEATTAFVHAILIGPGSARFLARFVPFARGIARLGAAISLAQLVLEMGSPGVPDVYQGGELWDLHLVDPDNRQRVDFQHRRALLDDLLPHLDAMEAGAGDATAYVQDLAADWTDGRIKLWITAALLRYRRRHADLFLAGDYLPVAADQVPVVALARASGERAVLAIAARHTGRIGRERGWPVGPAWADATVALPETLAGRVWRDAFTGRGITLLRGDDGRERLALAEVLDSLPVAWVEGLGR